MSNEKELEFTLVFKRGSTRAYLSEFTNLSTLSGNDVIVTHLVLYERLIKEIGKKNSISLLYKDLIVGVYDRTAVSNVFMPRKPFILALNCWDEVINTSRAIMFSDIDCTRGSLSSSTLYTFILLDTEASTLRKIEHYRISKMESYYIEISPRYNNTKITTKSRYRAPYEDTVTTYKTELKRKNNTVYV